MRSMPSLVAVVLLLVSSSAPGFSAKQVPARAAVPMYGYQIQHVYPHDPEAFTQGLEYFDGFLYEGTGLNGQSSVRKVALESGKVLQQRDMRRSSSAKGSPFGSQN